MSMKRFPNLKPTIWDGLVALAVILLAAGCVLALRPASGQAAGELTAVVLLDGRETDRFPLQALLEAPRSYSHNGYTLEIVAALKGRASSLDSQKSGGEAGLCVAHADCPTQDCVRTGIITRSEQSIICLPARIIIRLEGGSTDDDGPDIVVG